MREVFIDEWITGSLMSWFMNTLLLWTTARIGKKKLPRWRLLTAGLVGGLYHLSFCYRWELGLVGKEEIFYFAGAGIFLLTVAFFPLSFRELMKTAGLFFLLAILTAGLTSAVYNLYWYSFQRQLSGKQVIIINLFALLILTELGWGLVHRLIWEKSCLIPIRLSFEGKDKEIPALLDTGNLLVDPLTKTPVVLVETGALDDILPAEVTGLAAAVFNGEFHPRCAWELEGAWARRIRFLTFNGLGNKKGFLLGVRPDELTILQKEPRKISRVLVGLYHLSSGSELYRALLPVSLVSGGK